MISMGVVSPQSSHSVRRRVLRSGSRLTASARTLDASKPLNIHVVPQARGGPFVFWDDLAGGFARAAALGFKVLAGSPDETVTEGLDGLRDRLKEYARMGARFAKWRAVIRITDTLPSPMCITVNAHALARYAALCQEQSIVPIVEPEVLMDGSHTIERSEEVTSSVLHTVFHALFDQCVRLEGMLLKPNMVISGKECRRQASVEEVAAATVRCLRRYVPAAVPGVVFLSGGQSDVLATAHLNAINRLDVSLPWKVSFSYGRALQDPAIEAWLGKQENLKAGQRAFHHRAKCNSAAAVGKYSSALEGKKSARETGAHRSDWHDD